MRLKKFKVTNYHSIDSEGLEKELPNIKVPFSIVGHNNSGKSNLVSAISMALGAKPFSPSSFNANDFHNKDSTSPILVEVIVEDPLLSSDAYNNVKKMPMYQLQVKNDDGEFTSSHYFCDEEGKKIFNPRSLRRSKGKNYSEDEIDILNESQKQGAEQVWKWKSKTPVYYIDSGFIQNQLKINQYTLLGKIMGQVKLDFESKSNIVPQKDGVIKSHVGKPRKDVFENAMQYLEKYVLSTDSLDELIKNIEKLVKKQLEIEGENVSLRFGFPSVDSFFDNLTFYLTDNKDKPQLPIDQMGKGFTSLFVVALFRAILSADEGGNIFIIEEPETFMHEHFQEYFYEVLCELAQNNQVIYTTHSKKFVNVFEPRSILKLKSVNYLKTELIYNDVEKLDVPITSGEFELRTPEDFAKYLKTLEPNLGNIIFASKVIVVEGAHDLLAYKTALSLKIKFGLNNIAIVSAWGKDTINVVVQLCKLYEIPFFVIHDWDLSDPGVDITKDNSESNSQYNSLSPKEKAQFTKNKIILNNVGNINLIHHNKPKLEGVLGILDKDKGAISVYEKLTGLSYDQVKKTYPMLISTDLENFLGIRTD